MKFKNEKLETNKYGNIFEGEMLEDGTYHAVFMKDKNRYYFSVGGTSHGECEFSLDFKYEDLIFICKAFIMKDEKILLISNIEGDRVVKKNEIKIMMGILKENFPEFNIIVK